MPAFLSPNGLTDPLTPAEAAAQAETLIAHAICPDLPDLTPHPWQAQYRPRDTPRAYGVPAYGTRVIGPSLLRRWPITALTRVTVDGTDITASCTFDTFSVRRDVLAPEFGPLALVTVEFQTGWSPADLPAPILQAMRLTAQSLLTAPPLDVESEKIGDHSIKYRVPEASGIPAAAQALLAPYRPVML